MVATGQGLLHFEFLHTLFFAGHYNNLDCNLEQRCSTVRLKVLEYSKAHLLLSEDSVPALEDTLWQVYKCFLMRLDYTVAFASLINAVWQRGDMAGFDSFLLSKSPHIKSRHKKTSPIYAWVLTAENLLENAAQLKLLRGLYQSERVTTLYSLRGRYTRHLFQRLISTVEMLGAFPEASHWTVTMLARLHKMFGPDVGYRHGVGAMLKPIGTEEAHGLLARALKQMRWRYNTEEHARRACAKSIRECDAEEVLSTLLLHRAGSYPGQVQTTDYTAWLVSGWNIIKRKHRHVDGWFTLPIAARWHRNFPALQLPDQNCGKVQMSPVPIFEVIPKLRGTTRQHNAFVQHSSTCGPPPT